MESSDEFKTKIIKQTILGLKTELNLPHRTKIHTSLTLATISLPDDFQVEITLSAIKKLNESLCVLMFRKLSVKCLEMLILSYIELFPDDNEYYHMCIINILESIASDRNELMIKLMSNYEFVNWLTPFFCGKYAYLYYSKVLNYFPKRLLYNLLIEHISNIGREYSRGLNFHLEILTSSNSPIFSLMQILEPGIQIDIMIYFMTDLNTRSIFLKKPSSYYNLLEKLSEQCQILVRQVIGARIQEIDQNYDIPESDHGDKSKYTRIIPRNIIVKNGKVYSIKQLRNYLKRRKVQEIEEREEQRFRQLHRINKKKIFLFLFSSLFFGSAGISSLVYNILFPISNVHLYRLIFDLSSLAIIMCFLSVVLCVRQCMDFRNKNKKSAISIQVFDHEILEY
jgi:hypothetical protein